MPSLAFSPASSQGGPVAVAASGASGGYWRFANEEAEDVADGISFQA